MNKILTIGDIAVRLSTVLSVRIFEPHEECTEYSARPWRVVVVSESVGVHLELEFEVYDSDCEVDLEASEERAREKYAEIVKQWEAALGDDIP